jgi:putative AdoMet-dependent methyltransferase
MTRSEHVDRFNHDEDADEYDSDVQNAADPIRAGYDQLLDWVRNEVSASQQQGRTVLELGSGTGNLTLRLLAAGGVDRIVCVDVSTRMTELAAAKLAHEFEDAEASVQFLLCDVLEALDGEKLAESGAPTAFDAIVSTYTLHHLTRDEKARLFRAAAARLRTGGQLVVGDLAFESAGERARFLDRCRASGSEEQAELALVIEDEFFWILEEDMPALESAGFEVVARRFSDLSWGIAATLAGS